MLVEILLIVFIVLLGHAIIRALWTGSIKAPGKGYIKKVVNSRRYWAIVIFGFLLLADFVFIFIRLILEKGLS